jgi:D-3-phosphoglycerate dehydrogenase
MNWKVLVSPNTLLPVLDEYRHLLVDNGIEIVTPAPFTEFLSEDELMPLVHDIDGAICGDDLYTEKVLKRAGKLRVLSKWGEGLDAIDLEAAKRLNIAVFRTAGALTDPVADTVMANILAFARNVVSKDASMKQGDWRKLTSVTLREGVLGIVGLGRIGKAVAKRAVSFGMEVIACDIRTIAGDYLQGAGIRMGSFTEVITNADYVSLCCDLNPSTIRIIDREELVLMKDSAILINAARGQLIAEAALVDALRNETIAGAALDVFEKEPLSRDSPLRTMNNCLLSAHNANASPAVFDFIHRKTIDNVIAGLKDE